MRTLIFMMLIISVVFSQRVRWVDMKGLDSVDSLTSRWRSDIGDSLDGFSTTISGKSIKVATHLQNNGIVNVMDYGAVGDGVTNDTDSLNAALQKGNYIYIPPGNTFLSDELIITDNTIIEGGGENSVLKYTGTPGNSFLKITGSRGSVQTTSLYDSQYGEDTISVASISGFSTNDWVRLKYKPSGDVTDPPDSVRTEINKIESISGSRITFIYPLLNLYEVGTSVELLDDVIENVKIKNLKIEAYDASYIGGNKTFNIMYANNVKIENVYFSKGSDNIFIDTCRNVTIRDCYFDESTWNDVKIRATNQGVVDGNYFNFVGRTSIQLLNCSFFVVSNNNITGAQYGVYVEHNSNHNVIANNNIHNTKNNGILLDRNANYNVINGNMISNCGNVALHVTYGKVNAVTGNIIANQYKVSAVYMEKEENTVFGGNIIADVIGSSAYHGLKLGDVTGGTSYIAVNGNLFYDIQGEAITFDNTSLENKSITITGNVFRNETIGGRGIWNGATSILSGTTIRGNVFSHSGANAMRIMDSTATGDYLVQTSEIDLSASGDTLYLFKANRDYSIIRVEILYTEVSSADAGVDVYVGRSGSVAYYFTYTTEVSKSFGYTKYMYDTDFTNGNTLFSGDVLRVGTVGGKTGTGKIKLMFYLVQR